jgi:hypothetical protein
MLFRDATLGTPFKYKKKIYIKTEDLSKLVYKTSIGNYYAEQCVNAIDPFSGLGTNIPYKARIKVLEWIGDEDIVPNGAQCECGLEKRIDKVKKTKWK